MWLKLLHWHGAIIDLSLPGAAWRRSESSDGVTSASGRYIHLVAVYSLERNLAAGRRHRPLRCWETRRGNFWAARKTPENAGKRRSALQRAKTSIFASPKTTHFRPEVLFDLHFGLWATGDLVAAEDAEAWLRRFQECMRRRQTLDVPEPKKRRRLAGTAEVVKRRRLDPSPWALPHPKHALPLSLPAPGRPVVGPRLQSCAPRSKSRPEELHRVRLIWRPARWL